MKQHCPLLLCWTRSITLILSILIVVLSLYIYHRDTRPVLALLESHRDQSVFLHDMIENKRLIATLVAAQASIFYPLFLLLNPQEHPDEKHQITIFESLMPSGLALSWAFCISFEDRINLIQALKPSLTLYLEHHLKYIVVITLLFEVIVIWMSFICSIREERSIQLPLDQKSDLPL
ncbi:hypothetical protein EDC96DRAFT_497331 [Choanephora cucurbitarum]|nr:hypothetical protein EDC96DRAFT_497331 [Choanephora cucurbitarum]